MALTGTVLLSNPVASDQLTARSVTVTVNGTALSPIDATSAPATFACNNGDLITVVATDTNAAGNSAPSAVFTITAPAAEGVPATPTVLGVTFA